MIKNYKILKKIINYKKLRVNEVSEDGIAVFKLEVLDNVNYIVHNGNKDKNRIILIIIFLLNFI